MKNDIPVYDISTISEFRQDDILVSRFSPYAISHKHLHYPHRHTFYHIVLFIEGSGYHSIDFRKFAVAPYQIYFMVPGQVHSWNFEGPVDGYVVNFSSTFFQSFLLRPDYLENFKFFDGTINNSVLDIPANCRKEIENAFEEILKEGTAKKQFSADYVRVLLLRIFIMISQLSGETEGHTHSSYKNTLLKNFNQLIEQNYTNLRLPKEYAELLYITPNHLNALCKDLLGMAAGEVIRNRIILETKRLLINLDLSISEISSRLNFNDNSYFSKFFKKQVGITPEDFRKRALKSDI